MEYYITDLKGILLYDSLDAGDIEGVFNPKYHILFWERGEDVNVSELLNLTVDNIEVFYNTNIDLVVMAADHFKLDLKDALEKVANDYMGKYGNDEEFTECFLGVLDHRIVVNWYETAKLYMEGFVEVGFGFYFKK